MSYSFNRKKVLSIVAITILALALPITIFLVRHQQNNQSNATAPDKLEAEGGTLNSYAQTKSDSQASGGQYVAFTNSTPTPTPTTQISVGTGGSYKPVFVNVTGGGSMPSLTGAISASSYGAKGDGITDDTQALQNAANAAAIAGKPLIIPYTSAFYKITKTVYIKGSIIGTGGMPTIKQTSNDHSWYGVIFAVENNTTGWIYNLHLVGQYNGEYFNYRSNPPTYPNSVYPDNEGAATIRLGGVNGFTIKGNILENPWGDGVYDGASSQAYPARNVLIDNNTFINAMRCAIAVTGQSNNWAIFNNKIIHHSFYVNPIDLEPNAETTPGENYITNFEFGYNNYQITSPYPVNELTNWFDPTPGRNIWIHDNYGSWIGEFVHQVGYKGASSAWFNVNVSNNIKAP